MALFPFGKKKTRSVALIDIGSASVGGAYAHYEEGKPPVIYYTARVDVEIREGETIRDGMLRSLAFLERLLIEEGAPALALQHLQTALAMQASPWLSHAQQLVLREKLGYLLHETGQHAPALTSNTRLLHDAQLYYGADAPVLCTLLNNLAQNAYEMRQFGESQRYLQRRLALAQRAQDYETEADCLFQLGVVDCEQGDHVGARTWFDLRVQRARSLDDPDLIDAALQAQQELSTRLQASGHGGV